MLVTLVKVKWLIVKIIHVGACWKLIHFLPNISQWRFVCSSANAEVTWWLSYGAMIKISRKSCGGFVNAFVSNWRFFSQTLEYHSNVCDWFQNIPFIIQVYSILSWLAITKASYYKVVSYSQRFFTVNHTPETSSFKEKK